MTCDLEPAQRQHVEGVCDRRERFAAPLVILAAKPVEAIRIGVKVEANAALILQDRRLAVRAARPVRLLAAKGSVKRHKIFPDIPVFPIGWHSGALHPRSIWSQAHRKIEDVKME